MPSRFLIATDLHQRAVLYKSLVKLCEDVRPDALILGGDFLHGTGLLHYWIPLFQGGWNAATTGNGGIRN